MNLLARSDNELSGGHTHRQLQSYSRTNLHLPKSEKWIKSMNMICLGDITRTHAHSPRILRAFSARALCAENTRRMRGECAENARRMRVSATRTFRVFSAHSPRNFHALKNLKKDPFFYFSKFSKIATKKIKKSKKFQKI